MMSVKPWSSVSTSRMLGLAVASLRSCAEEELSFLTGAPSHLQNIGKPTELVSHHSSVMPAWEWWWRVRLRLRLRVDGGAVAAVLAATARVAAAASE